MTLKERILEEMVMTPIEVIKVELWQEIGHRYMDQAHFQRAFKYAYKKVKAKKE